LTNRESVYNSDASFGRSANLIFSGTNGSASLSERMRLTSGGNLIINPSGTDNDSLLTVKASTTDGKQIHIVQSNDDRGWRFSARTDGHFYLAATHNGSDSNILNARYDTGNVGIGIIPVNYKLSVQGASNSGIFVKQGSQIADSPASTNFYSGLTFENVTTTNAWSIGYSQGAKFSINYFDADSTYTRVLTATGNGDVGIGTINPGSKLHVNGNTFTNGRFGMDFGSIRTYSALGNITINVGNLPVLDGNNWRQASIMIFYSGVSGGLEQGYHNVAFIRLRGLTSWNDLNVTDIVGSASISLSSNTTTGCTLTLNVNSIITGSAMAMLASGTSGQLS
jgi:hypothetical protein